MMPGFRPLRLAEMPPAIRASFVAEAPNGAELRGWIVREFEAQTHVVFSPSTWSPDDAATFWRWWWRQYEEGDIAARRHPRLQRLVYGSLSEKISALAQRHCHICSGLLPADVQFPIHILPIRISPQSRQSLKRINWAAFQRAIRSRFATRVIDLGPANHFCVALTYVMNRERKDRDLDNMTKALIDAFTRAIGIDDKDVHHLDALKIIDNAPEEYVYIRIGPSHLHDHSTVMVPVFRSSWAGADPLVLDDFLDKSRKADAIY